MRCIQGTGTWIRRVESNVEPLESPMAIGHDAPVERRGTPSDPVEMDIPGAPGNVEISRSVSSFVERRSVWREPATIRGGCV